MSENKANFSFDSSGQFLLLQIYLLGAALQIDRYQKAVNQQKYSKTTSVFMQLHEVSCLLEDLDCIRRYLSLGNFDHSSHQLWKTARDHIRHDIRDLISNSNDENRRKDRHKSLNLNKKLLSRLTFDKEEFIIGEIAIKIKDIKDYLDWANGIFQEYIDDSRSSGRLKAEGY